MAYILCNLTIIITSSNWITYLSLNWKSNITSIYFNFYTSFSISVKICQFKGHFCLDSQYTVVVKFNLFNHVLALFRAKFSCNLVIRYPIFRWELCKGCVWESVKKTQDVCTQEEPRNWILRLASDWQVAKGGTRVKHVGEMKGHDNWSTTGQNFQFGQAVSSWLKLVTRSSRGVESPKCPVWLKHDFLHSLYTLL